MNLKLKLDDWLQLVGMAGVIISLIMVGYQLKQNSELLRLQIIMEESYAVIDHERIMVDNERASEVWAKSLTDPTNLTMAERRIMEGYLWSFIELIRTNHRMSEAGLLTDEDWRFRVKADSGFYFGNAYGYAWYQAFSDNNQTLPKEIIDAIDEHLKNSNSDMLNRTQTYFQQQQEQLKKLMENN